MRAFTMDGHDSRTEKSSLWGRRYWRLWLLAFDLAVVTLALALGRTPLLKARQINYDGPAQWESVARGLVTIPSDSNLVQVAVDSLETALSETFRDRAQVRVKLQLPDAIAIKLEPAEIALWIDATTAVATDGFVVHHPATNSADALVWTTPRARGRSRHSVDATVAVGTWCAVMDADPRFAKIGSEWNYDDRDGWSLVASDGISRIILGKGLIAERAAVVSRLLDQTHSTIEFPCVIDARVPGQLIVWPPDRNGKMRLAATTFQH